MLNTWQTLAGWPQQNARGYRILEQPLGTMRPLRVVFIGAGASGICFSKFSQDLLTNVDIQIYEKNDDVGGTWLENRYFRPPGCPFPNKPPDLTIFLDTLVVHAISLLFLTSLPGSGIPDGRSTIRAPEKFGSTSAELWTNIN